jgi:hypothetical protein
MTQTKGTPMAKQPATITLPAALCDQRLLGAALGAPESWSAWLAVLKAAGGMATAMTADERALFATLAGGRALPVAPVTELWCIAGRRSGKSRVAAGLAVHTAAMIDHSAKLAPGERGIVAVLSATVAQAELIASYCRGFLDSSKTLAAMVESANNSEIVLKNGITISTNAANFRSVRGRSLLACIFDEVAFWRSDESRNPDLEIYRAVAPSLAASGGPLIAIGSPYRRVGLQASKFRDHYGRDSGHFGHQGTDDNA